MEAAALPRPSKAPPRRRLLSGGSDEALVARVRAGDDAAFEQIFDRYHRGLLAFCRHMLGSREEAEDALQHTLLSAYRTLRADDREIQLKAWLYTIARNRCLSILRARREHATLADEPPAIEGLSAEVHRRADLQQLLLDLQNLPDDQRSALVLFELGDHSHDEIASVLGVRREKVKALVFQARESLLASRNARDTPCAEIREQLATLTGGALRRATLRRHVEHCPGCAVFESEVKRQRTAMAVLLPVVPTLGLKSSVLAAMTGASAGGAAAGAVAAGSVAGSSSSGAGALVGLGAKGVGAKLLVAAAIAGGAGATGYVAVKEARPVHTVAAPPAHARPVASPAAAARVKSTTKSGANAAATHGAAAGKASHGAQAKAARHAGGAHHSATAHHRNSNAALSGVSKAQGQGATKAPGAGAQGKALRSHGAKARRGTAKHSPAKPVKHAPTTTGKALGHVKAAVPRAPAPAEPAPAQPASPATTTTTDGQSGGGSANGKSGAAAHKAG